MTPQEQLDLAAAYVALSNAHRLDVIIPLFAEEGVYHSGYVGEFKGRVAISEMMGGFFSRFPDVRWAVAEYLHRGDGAVEFAFTMRAHAAENGEPIERHGLERIEFDADGLIRRLSVLPPAE